MPPSSEAILRAHKAVRGLLKLPKKYLCMNLNSKDSLDACHNRRDTDWFQKLDRAGYQCGATNADMEEFAAKGTSMLILSAHPVLDFVKKHRKDNPHIFTSYDVEATAHHHGIRDAATISMIEQMMCAAGERAILNGFSASSRRIAELRKERGAVSSWFKKDNKVDKSDPRDAVAEDPDASEWDMQSESEARAEAEAAAEGSDDPLAEAKARDFIASADEQKELKKKAEQKSKSNPKPSPSPSPAPKHKKIIDADEEEDIDVNFDIEALREQRLRGYYRDRYDYRKNLMD